MEQKPVNSINNKRGSTQVENKPADIEVDNYRKKYEKQKPQKIIVIIKIAKRSMNSFKKLLVLNAAMRQTWKNLMQ